MICKDSSEMENGEPDAVHKVFKKKKKKRKKPQHNCSYPNTYNTGTNDDTVFMEKEKKCKHSTINR